MKIKTKLIASIMSICLVCAVFAIGVFALKTANLKIGGDVSFNATGVEATISEATLTNTTTPDEFVTGGKIDNSMTQSQINETFASWANIPLTFDENGNDITLNFKIKNDSTNVDHYIEMDYDYSFSNTKPNVDVFPVSTNDYILEPNMTDSINFGIIVRVLNKELNVPDDTTLNLTILLKHTQPVELDENGYYEDIYFKLSTATPYTASVNGANQETNQSYKKDFVLPAVVTDGINNYIVTQASLDEFYWGVDYLSFDTFTIPNSVTSVSGSNLNATLLVLPKSLTSIEESAFFAAMVNDISIPNSVVTIEKAAFEGCKMNTILIPNSVTSIGDRAFLDCSELQSIVIPASVQSIGNNAFGGTYYLGSVIVDEGNKVYDSRNDCNAIIETATNTLISGCSQTVIPSSVTSIGDYAFYGSQDMLTSFTIPSWLTSIGKGAFYECDLISVTFDDPTAWTANGTSLDLSDPEQNATYLTETYYSYVWTKA